jgi:hypothetical protein
MKTTACAVAFPLTGRPVQEHYLRRMEFSRNRKNAGLQQALPIYYRPWQESFKD